jgi:hypothetical protein
MHQPQLDPPFPPSDGLRDVTAEFAGPEIARILNLPMKKAVNIVTQVEHFIRRFLVLPTHAYLPVALWAIATHMALVFDTFPYLALLSPAKRCGKTRVLEVLGLLCARVYHETCPSPAALIRMMQECPTLLLDETEMLRTRHPSEGQQVMLAVLNSGYKQGASVSRCVGKDHEVKRFPTYSPKAFAAIGKLTDTLEDRSICLPMRRRKGSEKTERFFYKTAKRMAAGILAETEEWAGANADAVDSLYQSMDDLPFLANERDVELWMPLFAVCSRVTPERLPELRECCLSLTRAKAANDVDDSTDLKLLKDIDSIWIPQARQMSTTTILERLKAMEESQWRDLDAHRLASLVRPFGLHPRSVRIGPVTPRGYLREQLDEALESYGLKATTTATLPMNIEQTAHPQPATSVLCVGQEISTIPA